MTLIEAVVAVFVMVTGVAALMGMILNVENANRSLALQHISLDVFAQVSAQIRDAECDLLPGRPLEAGSADPAFLPGIGNTGQWITARLPDSAITLVGDGASNPALAEYVPPVSVAYRVRQEVNPFVNPSFQVDVQIRQVMRDPAMNNINDEDGYWIRIYPVQKLCNVRPTDSQRGEYP